MEGSQIKSQSSLLIYRLLRDDDIIQEGDEYGCIYDKKYEWFMEDINCELKVSEARIKYGNIYWAPTLVWRRKVKNAKRFSKENKILQDIERSRSSSGG